MPPDQRRQRVVLTSDGPVLVEGPVDVELPDGRRVSSERPVTALCLCGNSRRYPICDTSHRRRVRSSATAAPPTPEPTPVAPTTAEPAPQEER